MSSLLWTKTLLLHTLSSPRYFPGGSCVLLELAVVLNLLSSFGHGKWFVVYSWLRFIFPRQSCEGCDLSHIIQAWFEWHGVESVHTLSFFLQSKIETTFKSQHYYVRVVFSSYQPKSLSYVLFSTSAVNTFIFSILSLTFIQPIRCSLSLWLI